MRGLKKRITEDPIFGILLVAPLLTWIVITLVYPLIEGIQISFQNLRYYGMPAEGVGFANYARLLGDRSFLMACLRTLSWTFWNVVLQVGLSVVVALVLNQKFKGQHFIRNWIVLPWVLPSVVLVIMWRWILEPTRGVANFLLMETGITSAPIEFLASAQWAMPSAIMVNSWRWIPFFSIMVLAALQTIPKELTEAATVDGASAWRRFWHIKLPLLFPVLGVVTLSSFLWSANIFDTLWLLTRGGPLDFTTTLPIFIYEKAFREFRFSLAATAGVILFLLLLVFVIIYLRGLFREESQA